MMTNTMRSIPHKGKQDARVLEAPDGTRLLFSYETPVATFRTGVPGSVRTDEVHSRTTEKHITQFLQAQGVHPHITPRVTEREVVLVFLSAYAGWMDALDTDRTKA
jgi:hypothetical protein